MNAEELRAELALLLGDAARVHTNPAIVERLSKDFYWYSPVLRKQLEDKRGDVVVQPASREEVCAIASYAWKKSVPVTVRGAGTGNYGQCVPLAGGIVLDMTKMDRLEAITDDGTAICQPGARLAAIEREARAQGWELRMYPSTLARATAGGFLAGGSGGIGSVKHGGLRNFGNVRGIEIVTIEQEPRLLLREGTAIHEVLHCWGTNGIFSEVRLALAPAVDWTQCAIAFDSFEAGFAFGFELAADPAWDKRLVTVFEWPIPSFFSPIQPLVAAAGKALVFAMIASSQLEALRLAAAKARGEITFADAYAGPKSQPLLSDYTWNHTTLWAMKADPKWTYIQAGFSPDRALEQFRLLRARYGQEILFHIEFMKNGEGQIVPGSIPLVYFTGEQRLNELIDFCREIGVSIANPHVNSLEHSGRFRTDSLQIRARRSYDPRGLLNPGKMTSFSPEAVSQ